MVEYQGILFVCTGNFYRSRFAEALFNHHAAAHDLEWRASSRGLRTHLAEGDLSPLVSDRLKELGVSIDLTGPTPVTLCELDLISASKVIALKEAEHLPMMLDQFPAWAARIDYWHIHDIDVDPPEKALPEIEHRVVQLVEAFSRGCALGVGKSLALEF